MPVSNAGTTRIDLAVGEFEITNKYGIHARPAALMVKAAAMFDCDISVSKGTNTVSGKSIMGLMTLEASKGSRLKIRAQGRDARQALEELKTLIEGRFGEE